MTGAPMLLAPRVREIALAKWLSRGCPVPKGMEGL